MTTNVSSSNTMVAELSKKRNGLINASYENPGGKSIDRSTDKAIIDIISNYAWNNETSSSDSDLSFSMKTNIPYCLVIEREQTVASSIMNIVRDISVISQGINKVTNFLKNNDTVQTAAAKAKEKLER